MACSLHDSFLFRKGNLSFREFDRKQRRTTDRAPGNRRGARDRNRPQKSHPRAGCGEFRGMKNYALLRIATVRNFWYNVRERKTRMKMPFRYGCVVDGEYFCPRPELERQLRRYAESGQNLVIQGERRMGKTSLVKRPFPA